MAHNRKYLKAITNLVIALVVFSAILFLLPIAVNFMMPFIVAGIISLIANPLVVFLEGKVKIKRKAGTVMVIVFVIGLVILVLYLVISKLTVEFLDFINDFPDIWSDIESELNTFYENFSHYFKLLPFDVLALGESISSFSDQFTSGLMETAGSPTFSAVGNFAKSLPSVLISIIMSLLASYFFIAEKDFVLKSYDKYMPHYLRDKMEILNKSLGQAVGGYFKAQLKIEIWIYFLMVLGFAILGLKYALIIALGIAFLDFLPFFGTGLVLIPWTVLSLISSDLKMAVGLFIIWGGGQLVRQLIQPKIMGDSMGLPAIPTLILLYLGFRIGGVLGMILAIPIGIIIKNLYMEGMFDTILNSIRILMMGINRFRKLTPSDLADLHKRNEENSSQNDREKYDTVYISDDADSVEADPDKISEDKKSEGNEEDPEAEEMKE